MIISKTPLRISFVGGGTDLPSFYSNYEYGSVVSTAINSYLYVTVKKQNDIFNEKFRLNYSETELVNSVNKIKNPIIKESLKFMNIDERLYISTIADVPSHTGLGSSSSFTVGLLNALYKFKKQKVSKHKLAEEASHIEIDRLKLSLGKQDHYAAAFGGLNRYKFINNGNVEVKKIKINKKNLNKLSSSILIFWTGITRSSEPILKSQKKNTIHNNEILKKMRDHVIQFSDCLENDYLSLKKTGEIIDKGWHLKKSLSNLITESSIDKFYKKIISKGSFGGKLAGAGGGGFLFFIVNPNNKNVFNKLIDKVGYKKYNFGFDFKGSTVIEFDK